MNSIRFLVLIAFLVISGAIQGAEFVAKVIAVLDGDTVLIRRDGALVKIRLAGIDAPEVGHAGIGGKPPNSQEAQPFGETSKHSLSGMVLNKQVKITSQATDQYGRMVAYLDVDGLDVNAEQVRRGMAWEYPHYRPRHLTGEAGRLREEAVDGNPAPAGCAPPCQVIHKNRALFALQEEARQVPRGLWALSDPVPPWEWRKLHPFTPGGQTHAVAFAPETAQAVPLDPLAAARSVLPR